MPPIRTQNKKSRGMSALTGLDAYEGATATAKQRATQSARAATARLTDEREAIHLAEDDTASHAIGESEEACEYAPTQAELLVKGAGTAQKTSMPTNKGQKEVTFQNNEEWESNHEKLLGYQTKKVVFGSNFVLKDQHINELTLMGPRICKSLTHFEFLFDDVSYDAKNSAEELTDKAIIHLAELCPNLRFVQLQGTSGLQDITLEALFNNCANISHVELTTHSRHGNSRLDGSALDKLREHPHWGTKLKKLRLPSQDTRCDGRDSFTRAVRALTKERNKLLVQLVSVSEVKKWGDWELEVYHTNFRKGRKQTPFYF
ncbi:hypothetical protein Plec18167_006910 [Paecilomyces lecythidis]|uniref:Uncharacterized protein n=1 Tax=Paecilomyces lecythidis TaxID=3004212 RepID=A0ABR3X7F4_9EURO